MGAWSMMYLVYIQRRTYEGRGRLELGGGGVEMIYSQLCMRIAYCVIGCYE